MSVTEWAIIVKGEIENVVTCTGPVPDTMIPPEGMLRRLDDVPLEVKKRYRYWDERP